MESTVELDAGITPRDGYSDRFRAQRRELEGRSDLVSSAAPAVGGCQAEAEPQVPTVPTPTRLGLALGGGFARGMAHIGVLQVLKRNNIAVDCIAGASAGRSWPPPTASGATPEEIAEAGSAMRFGDVARSTIGHMEFVLSERMERFLRKALKCYCFEQMTFHLG